MSSTVNDAIARLREELSIPVGDDENLEYCVNRATAYVASAIGDNKVDDIVRLDCIVSCAADLYSAKSARLGVMSVADGTLEPFRISTDPLRSVWAKLNAAGVLTGKIGVA